MNLADRSTWVFVTNQNGISGLKVTVSNGTPTLTPIWHNSCNCTLPAGHSPIVANSVVYVANPNDVMALNPLDGSMLWQDTSIGTVAFGSWPASPPTGYIDHQEYGIYVTYAPT